LANLKSWALLEQSVAGSWSGSPTCIILLHRNLRGIKKSTSKHWAASSIINVFICELPWCLSSDDKQSKIELPLKLSVHIITSASFKTLSFDSYSNFFLKATETSLLLVDFFKNF